MNIQRFLIQADRVCDWVPILSTVNNLVDLFIKTVVLPRIAAGCQPAAIRANHYYSHLDKKTFTRCTLLLIPILGQIIIYLADLLYDNKPFALELVKRNGLNLQGVSERLRHDRDVVLAAIKENHLAIEYAGEEFDEDSEIMSAYQKGNPPLSNRQQVLAAIEKDPMAIGEVGEEFWDDKEVMLAALKRNGNLFIYASDRLKDDEDILLAAVPTNARALGLASRRIQDSEDIMLKALGCSDARVLYSVSDRLKDSKEFMRRAIELNPFAMACASKSLRKDRELTLLAVTKDVRIVKCIAKGLCDDEEVMLTVAKKNGIAFTNYASKRLQGDKKIIIQVIKWSHEVFFLASEELQKDKDVLAAYNNSTRFVGWQSRPGSL